MRTTKQEATGSTPAPRADAVAERSRRRASLRLVRSERRRLERPAGRFAHLKRTYD